jgi:hypothetical protein
MKPSLVMETPASSQVSVCEILERFPLEFIPDIKQSDRDLVVSCVKVFKGLAQEALSTRFNFLDPREIGIITEFFSRYGAQIRSVHIFFNAVKLKTY